MNISEFYPIPKRYIFKKELSHGFLTRTSYFEDKETGKSYVCKSIEKESFLKLELTDFLSYVEKLHKYQFSFVQQYTERYETDKYCVLIRPYIEGDCLAEMISNAGENNFDQMYNIWKIIYDHFTELHTHSLCPNFIKPNNIFILENGNVVLVDLFPPPNDVDLMLRSISIFYIGFLAPEFFTANEQIGKESDLWSLGVLLVFMLTKSLPWKSNNIFTILQQINSCTINLVIKIPDEFVYIIKGLIQKKPEMRKLNQNISITKKMIKIVNDKDISLPNKDNSHFMTLPFSLKQSKSMTNLVGKGIQLRTRQTKDQLK